VAFRIVDLIRCEGGLRAFLTANALWEFAYVTETLGLSLAGSSGVIAAAALIVLVGAVVSGPAGAHGLVTGLYSLSRGLGISLGPLLGGVAIEAAGEDYRWGWLVCAAAILASLLPLLRLSDDR
jgi:MFS family permease